MLREIVTTGETSPILSLAHFDLASLYYERNELDKAEERLNLGVVLSEPSRNADFQNAGTVLLGLLRLAQGDTAKALEAAERSQKLVKNQYLPARARSAALHVQVALAMGNPETAVRWGEQVTFGVDTNSYLRFLDLTQPRLLIALDRKEEASERLRACYEKSVRSSVLRVHRQVT